MTRDRNRSHGRDLSQWPQRTRAHAKLERMLALLLHDRCREQQRGSNMAWRFNQERDAKFVGIVWQDME
jgi:hypothetical protein